MLMTAILTYVFSEDLSLRPRLHGSSKAGPGRSLSLYAEIGGGHVPPWNAYIPSLPSAVQVS
jgi:hypothetical protein